MKKLNNKKGFTLAELLIVVAIIGVLTVVAVPVFTTQLEKSREATDIANLREAKAAAISAYMAGETITDGTNSEDMSDGGTLYFDAANGKVVPGVTASKPSPGYGKGTKATGDAANDGLFDYDVDADPGQSGLVIKIVVDDKGECTFTWE